jgi:hypothetical protein
MSTTISSTGSRIGAEFFGMATLTAVVIGSGIMETNLSQDLGIALYFSATRWRNPRSDCS